MKNPTNRNLVHPILNLLTDEQINIIHKYSIKILENTGVKVESKAALKLFESSSAVRIENDVVFIQEELSTHCINSAPSNVTMYKKSGEEAFTLGEEKGSDTFFGIGVTNTNFQNIKDDTVIPFTRKHMQNCTALGDLLNNYDMISTIGIPSDVEPEKLDLFSTLDMYSNTNKPLVLLVEETENINKVFDLISHLHGDISSKPFCIPYFNPITPLILNADTTDKMIASINHGLPIMFSNYSMYGATTPMNETGTLALLNAELLAGLVFSQLVKEGTPVILGSLPAAFNMISSGSYYTPSSYLLNLACAEMMNYYNIPHCGTSGSGNGWGSDLVSCGNLWQNHLTSCIGKVGCVPFVGGNFDSMAFSPSLAVLSNQIIGEAKQFAKGFMLNEDKLNYDEINETSHGGNYLTSLDTINSLAELNSSKQISPSLNLSSWKEMNKPKVEDYLREYTLDVYSTAIKSSESNIDIIRKGEEFIDAIG